MEYAAVCNAPFSPEQIVDTVFHVLFTTGMFHDDYKLWKRRPAHEKIWANFKLVFAIAHQELIESTQTAQGSGYQSNNTTEVFQQETINAIENLANATMADRKAMAELTATISRLIVELADANTKLVKMLSNNNTLIRQLDSTSSSSRAITTNVPRLNTPEPQDVHYCFTHVIKSSHTSKDYNSPAETHNKNATDANKMGGRTTKWKVGGRA